MAVSASVTGSWRDFEILAKNSCSTRSTPQGTAVKFTGKIKRFFCDKTQIKRYNPVIYVRNCMRDFAFHAQSSWTAHETDKG